MRLECETGLDWTGCRRHGDIWCWPRWAWALVAGRWALGAGGRWCHLPFALCPLLFAVAAARSQKLAAMALGPITLRARPHAAEPSMHLSQLQIGAAAIVFDGLCWLCWGGHWKRASNERRATSVPSSWMQWTWELASGWHGSCEEGARGKGKRHPSILLPPLYLYRHLTAILPAVELG